MKKRIVALLMLLCLSLSLFAACHSQESGLTYRFADHEEAAAIKLAERTYFENLNQNDLNYRMQKLDATREALEAYTKEQMLDYSDEEKAALDGYMARFLADCEERGYHLPAMDGVVFCKSTMHEECDAGAYTHGTNVFFGESIMQYALSEDPETQNWFYYIFAHELFHCLTRNNPSFRKDMYGLLGFTVVDRDYEFSQEIKDAIISNPDVEHHNSYATFDIDGELKECTVVFISKAFEQPGDSFFDGMQTGLVPIDDLSVLYTSDQAANFWDVFGRNTDYVIDPEETLADNFGYLFAYGLDRDYATPELIRSIDAYLKS